MILLFFFRYHVTVRKDDYKTRCVAMPSLWIARWVGRNSGVIFRRLWTKVNRIKFACAGVSV